MKTPVTLDHLNAQAALELPDREMLLVTIVIANVLSGNDVDIDVRNVNVGVQVCAAVNLINSIVDASNQLTCTIQQ